MKPRRVTYEEVRALKQHLAADPVWVIHDAIVRDYLRDRREARERMCLSYLWDRATDHGEQS